jgi:hypothetical protein
MSKKSKALKIRAAAKSALDEKYGNGPLTLIEVVDRLCPEELFDTHEGPVDLEQITVHPILGEDFTWEPTPMTDKTRSLLYAMLKSSCNKGIESDKQTLALVEKLMDSNVPVPNSRKELDKLCVQLDTNLIVIDNMSFRIHTPDIRVFNTNRHLVIVYYDGALFHSLDNSVYDTLREAKPKMFKDARINDFVPTMSMHEHFLQRRSPFKSRFYKKI